MSAISDQHYIDKILQGDTNTYAVLVDRYKNMIFTLALKMVTNREEAEEVAQDTFIKAYNSLVKFKGDSKFSTWIFIGISLAALTAYAIYFNNDISNFEIAKTYSDKASALFSGIHFSTNVLYALLVVPFMVLIQIGVLKNYFDKKYEL